MLFWVGAIMVAPSLVIFAGALRRRPGEGPQLSLGARWRKVVLVVVALVAYAWRLRRLA